MLCGIVENGVSCTFQSMIKHHIQYFPEETIGVCELHHDKIHLGIFPELVTKYIHYRKGDAQIFYQGKERIENFLIRLRYR